MAHVLIDGESRILADVHEVLRRWGHTVGRLSADARARGRASEAECDAVLFLCDQDPDGTEILGSHLKAVAPVEVQNPGAEEPMAPLLVIGQGHLAETMGRQAHQLIPEIGPGGSHLKKALDICLEGEPRIGSAGRDRCDRDQQLHFLGHELRSPLTAIKTALEVVQGDLWGLIGEPEMEIPAGDHSLLRMLEIALRNVRRMNHTVEWSQDLLKFEDDRSRTGVRSASLENLGRELSRSLGSEVRIQGRDQTLECEVDLVIHLAGLAVQAVRFGDGNLDLTVTLDTETVGLKRLRLEILRTDASGSDCGETGRHLQRFADFLNPSGILRRAGGEVRVCGGPDEKIGLTLTVEFHPAGSDRVSLVG